VPDAPPSSAGSPGRPGVSRSGAWVGLALLAQVLLLEPGCLPQEKLSSYSRAWTEGPAEGSPDAANGESTGFDASAGGGGALGGNGGSSNDASNASGSELADADAPSDGEPDASTEPTSLDAGPTESDAGGVPLTTPLTDAGAALGP
jgi:hypothetical protein